jgi:hypothetical protein
MLRYRLRVSTHLIRRRMTRLHLFLRLLFIAAWSIWPASAIAFAADRVDFDRDIAPLLVSRCFDCHSGATIKGALDLSRRESASAGGESGVPFVSGKPDESLLWQRVSEGEMPPKKPLAADEQALLKAWITQGANWGTSPINPFRVTTSTRAGYDWWSLQPITRPVPPIVRNEETVRSPIDVFVLAKLESVGLKASPEADRRTLIRRLTFDLTGLPPEPEEVQQFVTNPDPQAYERLVDRLLASPHYGERWARHWLDLARFGESNGFEYDEPRRNAWPYRDWVIHSLNADLPFDEFAGGIAGVLRPGTSKQSGDRVSRRRPVRHRWAESAERRNESGRAAGRVGRSRQHGFADVPRTHRAMCAMPRPQIRPDPAIGILSAHVRPRRRSAWRTRPHNDRRNACAAATCGGTKIADRRTRGAD